MRLKKWLASTLSAVFVFTVVGTGSAFAWHSATIHIPKRSSWYTVTRPATGSTQYTKVTYVGGNKCIYQRIVNQSHKNMSPEKGCTVGVSYSHKTNAKKGTPIAAKFRNTAYVNVQATAAWKP